MIIIILKKWFYGLKKILQFVLTCCYKSALTCCYKSAICRLVLMTLLMLLSLYKAAPKLQVSKACNFTLFYKVLQPECCQTKSLTVKSYSKPLFKALKGLPLQYQIRQVSYIGTFLFYITLFCDQRNIEYRIHDIFNEQTKNKTTITSKVYFGTKLLPAGSTPVKARILGQANKAPCSSLSQQSVRAMV